MTKINADANRALASADIREKIIATGGEPQGGGSDEFAAYIRTEIAKWGKTIKDAKITFE